MIRESRAIPSSFLSKTLYSNCIQMQSVISTVGQVVPIFWDDLSHGGDDGIRTHDPLLAGQVLSQLSYTPKFEVLLFLPVKSSLLRSKNFTAEGNFTLAFAKISPPKAISLRNKVSLGRPKWTRTTLITYPSLHSGKAACALLRVRTPYLGATGRPKWTRTTDLVLIRHAL